MKRHAGQALIQTLGLVFVTILTGPFVVDAALYYCNTQMERNAADAAALSAVNELFRGDYSTSISTRQTNARTAAKNIALTNYNQALNDGDIEFGYVNPMTNAYDAGTFLTPTTNTAFSTTGGYNAIRINVRAGSGQANGAVPTLFAKYLGLNSIQSASQAVSVYGGGVTSATGLRPIYICQAAYEQAKTLYTDPTKPKVRFYGSTLTLTGPSGTVTNINQASSCGNLGPGNWGLADFDGNGGGASQLNNNITNGYSGTVTVNDFYGPKPGNALSSSSSELQTLITNGTIITLPLYSQTSGNGANAQFKVSMIAPFKITAMNIQGNNSWVEGYFQKSVCPKGCSLGSSQTGGLYTTLKLVH